MEQSILNSPFYKALKDDNATINFDGNVIPIAFYNLVLSKRDVALFCMGMKPNRYWRLKDVKEYFGVKGSKEKVKEQLNDLCELLTKN